MSRKGKKTGSLKKVIVIGVIAALVGSVVAFYNPSPPEEDPSKALFCGSGTALSNRYIQEFVIPTECSEPVGITIDPDGMVWFAESGARKIARFDPSTDEFIEHPFPDAREREEIVPVASIWSMKFDEQGKLWLPDVPTNAIWKFDPNTGIFEKYSIPSTTQFGTSYPINLEFRDGKIWFSEIYGKNIGILDPALARHGTTSGITEISARVDLETLGPLAMDDDGGVWFTALTYPAIGRLMKLDPEQNTFQTYEMPGGIASPVGIVFDRNGNLWINDHGTSTILKFNPRTNETTTYVTSLPLRKTSIGLYENCLTQPGGSALTCAGFPVSLPYWNAVDSEGRIWFNEHQGNSIAVFDPSTLTLIEYFVPSQNSRWGDCEDFGDEPCGIANPLQFTIAPDGRVWFTEWSENKIGVLDPTLPLPVSLKILATGKEQNLVSRGDTLTLNVAVTANERLTSDVQMRISGTIVPTGRLFNMTAEFSEKELTFSESSTKTLTLKLTPEEGIAAGDYRITVSARYNEVTYSEIVEIRVEPSKTER